MNDMVKHEPQQMQALRPKSYGQIIKLAQMACESGMVPKTFVNEPHKTAVAMMMLAENDLPVMTGLKYVAVINGQPAFFSDAVPGIARKRGLVRHRKEWWDGTGENRTAHCEVINSDGDTFKRSFSVADARRAKLWNKETYQQYPDTMLMWRARNSAIRDAAPDAFMGPTVEELEALAAAFVGPDHAKEINPPQQPEPTNNSPLAPQIRPARSEAPRAAQPEARQQAQAPEPVAETAEASAPAEAAASAAQETRRRGQPTNREVASRYLERIHQADDHAELDHLQREPRYERLCKASFEAELETAIERRRQEIDEGDSNDGDIDSDPDELDAREGTGEAEPTVLVWPVYDEIRRASRESYRAEQWFEEFERQLDATKNAGEAATLRNRNREVLEAIRETHPELADRCAEFMPR
jgi:hypothetical protein